MKGNDLVARAARISGILITTILTAVLTVALPFRATAAGAPMTGAVRNPLAPVADPFIVRAGGSYYLTGTGDGASITLYGARTIACIRDSVPTTVWKPAAGQPAFQVWSPSLFFLPYQGVSHWFLYFTASPDNANEDHRIYVLEGVGADPRGPYTFHGRLRGSDNVPSIDPSILRIRGSLYIMYVEELGSNATYIARLRDPLTQAGSTYPLITPDRPWERGVGSGQSTYPVAEGPEALYHAGRTFVVYSGSDTGDYTYCLGLLAYDGHGNPLNRRSWRKTGPVFQYSRANGVYGPGRASFTASQDGRQDWMVYHAKDTPAFTYVGRTTRAQTFTWNADGTPHFGVPVRAAKSN